MNPTDDEKYQAALLSFPERRCVNCENKFFWMVMAIIAGTAGWITAIALVVIRMNR